MPTKKYKLINRKNDVFAARDNTLTANTGSVGYIANADKVFYPEEADITENPLGYMPVVGDILQGGQAIIDAGNGHWGRAALNAGLLLVPNMVEKPVKQVLRNGVARILRHAPTQEIHLSNISQPYKGQNFVMHGTRGGELVDVFGGETRAMSPSLAVNRVGDVNIIPDNVGWYGDHHFVLDPSVLDNSAIYNGDVLTPTVLQRWPSGKSVPSELRQGIADDIWEETVRLDPDPVRPRIGTEDLNHLDTPGDGYFEAKYHGLLPLESARMALMPEPGAVGTILDPKTQEAIIRGYENLGLPVTTYNGYDDKVEKLYTYLIEHPEVLRRNGGRIHIKPENRGKFTALKKRTGHSASWFKAHGTPAQKKMAVFALNSRKWKHGDGGVIDRLYSHANGDTQTILSMIRKAKGLKE